MSTELFVCTRTRHPIYDHLVECNQISRMNNVQYRVGSILHKHSALGRCKTHPKHTCTIVHTVQKILQRTRKKKDNEPTTFVVDSDEKRP